MSNLLDKYSPAELARITYCDLQNRKKTREREINDYHYKAVDKSIDRRRKRG